MNTPVSSPLAKLLKEKGFDIPVLSCYFKKDEISENYSIINQYEDSYIEDKGNFLLIPYDNNGSLYLEKINFNGWGDLTLSAPTIAEVVMWLYEKHEIWIELTMGKDHTGVWFDWDIFSTITPRKDDMLGEEGVEYEDDPNEKWLNYDTTYSSMIDERFATMNKESCLSPTEAYEVAIKYCLKKII